MVQAGNKPVSFDLNTQRKISVFSMARLCLMAVVLITTTFLKQEVLGEEAITQIYTVLAVSFFLSLVTVVYWEATLRVRYFMVSQLFYDLLLTSYLVYLTGVNDSIFLFLYLLNIVFSSVVFQLNGALVAAGLSGAIYAFIYSANVSFDDSSALYNLAHSELLFLLTALLCGQLMDELKRQKTMLESQKVDIARLELLNNRLLNSIPAGILLVDSDGFVLNVNRTALRLLHLDHAPEMRIRYFELLPDLRGVLEGWDRLTETQRHRFLFRIGEGSRPRFSLDLVRLPAGDAGGSTQYILVFQDISKTLELEAKLEFESKLSATGQLAAGIAHEIRNPLASISGSIELLSKHLPIQDEEDRRLMDISLREIRRLNVLITDFLEFAKPRDTTADDFPFLELVRETAETIRQRATQAPVEFITNVPETIGLHANRERINQVLFNLFLNALEAGGDGTVRITVEASEGENGQVIIDVRDNGPGVLPGVAHRVFDPFYTTKINGTGLGLATVAQIMKAAKGEIKLLPNRGGAHFRLTLPAAQSMKFAGTGS